MLTIGLNAGATHPEIDWPQRIEQDDQIVRMIREIRMAGVGVVANINKSQGGMDTLEFRTEFVVALYRRGLYVPPLSAEEFFKMDEVVITPSEPPLPCWILTQVENIGVAVEPPVSDYSVLAHELARHIPDINKTVKSPCKCRKYTQGTIFFVIQHLNDFHHPKGGKKETWTREQIADWLDEVDADLVFDPDLPAKRAARREQARQMMVMTGDWPPKPPSLQSSVFIKKISDDLTAVQPKIDELKDSFVKLDVAIEQFAATIHENLSKSNIACTCPACAPEEES